MGEVRAPETGGREVGQKKDLKSDQSREGTGSEVGDGQP